MNTFAKKIMVMILDPITYDFKADLPPLFHTTRIQFLSKVLPTDFPLTVTTMQRYNKFINYIYLCKKYLKKSSFF